MKPVPEAHFKQRHGAHLKRLRSQGLQPKTIAAYARAIRHLRAYCNGRIDDLTEGQLADYFSDTLASHSCSRVKHRLYGRKFYYAHVLRKPCPAPDLIKPPKVQRLPDVVTVAEASRLFRATRVVNYRVLLLQVRKLGVGCEIAHLHVFTHALAKWGHDEILRAAMEWAESAHPMLAP